MKKEKFETFWKLTVDEWYKNEEVYINYHNQWEKVSEWCKIRNEIDENKAVDYLYTKYNEVKFNTKKYYFKQMDNIEKEDTETRLSRYKRAAVLTYTVLLANPLCQKDGEPLTVDPLFLKQRLAFFVALSSIIQDYDINKITKYLKETGKPVFQLSSLGRSEGYDETNEDSFCLSLYKDLFFAEHYDNYNILTMANIYGLLTERCSCLLDCKKDDNRDRDSQRRD